MSISEKELAKILAKGHCKLSVASNGAPQIARASLSRPSRSKSGIREDLQMFFRSTWEANYARYLNWLVANKQILKWEYETEEFELFRTVKGKRVEYKRGNRFYKIDFKIYNLNGLIEYHEIKGYLDSKSVTKLKRFRRCYPHLVIKLIDAQAYYSIQRQFRGNLPNWE